MRCGYTLKQKMLVICMTVYLFTLFVFIESADTYIYSKFAFLITFILAVVNIKMDEVYLTDVDIAFVLFTLLCCISCVWSQWQAKSIETSITMIQLSAMFVVFRMALRPIATKELFMSVILCAGIAMCIFYLSTYGISGYLAAMKGIGRIGSEFENTNTIGGSGAFIITIAVIQGIEKRKWYYYLAAAISAFIVIGSGSKAAILVSLVGILIAILYSATIRKNSKLHKFAMIVTLGVALLYIINNISSIPFLNSILERFEEMFADLAGRSMYANTSTTYRMKMNEVGLNAFLSHPLSGVGIYAMKDTLASNGLPYIIVHCNYIELLADLGIIGFLVYYYVYYYMLRRIRKCSINKSFAICMVFLMLLIDVTGVTYYSQRFILFLVLTSLAVEEDEGVVENVFRRRYVFGNRP